MTTVTIHPASDGSLLQCYIYPASPTTHFDKVDEVTPNDATDYVRANYSQGETDDDCYHISLPGELVGTTINSVTIYIRIWTPKEANTYGHVHSLLRSAAVNYLGASKQSAAWGTASDTYALSPFTGVAWTVAEIANMQIGQECTSADTTLETVAQAYCSTTWIDVDYTAGGATYTKTFTSDSHLLKRQTKTATTDARLLKRIAKTAVADALLKYVKQKQFVSDAHLLKRQTKTFSADALLLEAVLKALTTDALLLKRQVKTASSDAHLLKRAVKSFMADAILEAAGFKGVDTDALLLKRIAKTFTADAYLTEERLKGFVVDGLLLKHQTATFTVDAWLITSPVPTVPLTTGMVTRRKPSGVIVTVDGQVLLDLKSVIVNTLDGQVFFSLTTHKGVAYASADGYILLNLNMNKPVYMIID